jgi:hypothetical protein
MLFVLLTLMLLATITLSTMQLIVADSGGGVREVHAGQVFNIAQAGVHYAIGKLQLPGAALYRGETLTVAAGGATLGTTSIVVNCTDTGAPPPCTGPYAAYRRIIATGRLPTNGASRTIVAVVQATTVRPAICADVGGVDIRGGSTVNGDVGSNAAIVLAGPPFVRITGDRNAPPQFKGTAAAVGTISCGASCTRQVEGGILASQPAPVCPALPSPTYAPGGTNLYVHKRGFVMTQDTGYSWNKVWVAPGSCSGSTPFNDLTVQADPVKPYATTVVQINSLVMGNCSRLIIGGVGKIELRIGAAGYTGLVVLGNARFGVLPTDAPAVPAPVPAGRFVVWVNSGGAGGQLTAVQFLDTQIVAGTILAPQGRITSTATSLIRGALWGYTVSLDTPGSFLSDITGLPPDMTHAKFNKLRSWKDE